MSRTWEAGSAALPLDVGVVAQPGRVGVRVEMEQCSARTQSRDVQINTLLIIHRTGGRRDSKKPPPIARIDSAGAAGQKAIGDRGDHGPHTFKPSQTH
jgi:hypothetical protein